MLNPLHPDTNELWGKKKPTKVLVWLLWIITVLHLENSDILKYPLIKILYFNLKQTNKKPTNK